MHRLVKHRKLPFRLHRMANVACCLVLVPAVAASRALEALVGTKGVCEVTSDCARPFVCIDSGCMCTPLWAHTGADCSDMSSTSWALTAVLVLVAFYAINALATAARKGSPRSTKSCSGMYELVVLFFRPPQEHDSGSTTMRVVIGTALIEAISHIWKILAAVGAFSDRTSAYWDERVLLPLSEGSNMLASGIVISVWVDVANSSMSRAKSKRKLDATKRALEAATVFYMIMLAVLCVFDHLGEAMTVHLMVLGLSVIACGMGAAKLCNALRSTGENNEESAQTVFKVSRVMGLCFYAMFVGNAIILSSRTRKSNPANLALLGVIVSSLGKCFLNKVIFEYACESARAKRTRADIAKRNQSWSLSKSKVTSPMRSAHQSSSVARLGAARPSSSHLAKKVSPTENGPSEPLRVHDPPPTTGLADAEIHQPAVEGSASREGAGGGEVEANKAGTVPALPSGGRKAKRKSDMRHALPDAPLVGGGGDLSNLREAAC